MIDVGTRVRVSEIATELWRLLQHRIRFFVDTEEFELAGHGFGNTDADAAVVECSLTGDPAIAIHVRGVKITFRVTGVDSISVHVHYGIGSKSTGSASVITRDKTVTVRLQPGADDAVVRQAWSMLVTLLRADIEIMMKPYKAFSATSKGR